MQSSLNTPSSGVCPLGANCRGEQVVLIAMVLNLSLLSAFGSEVRAYIRFEHNISSGCSVAAKTVSWRPKRSPKAKMAPAAVAADVPFTLEELDALQKFSLSKPQNAYPAVEFTPDSSTVDLWAGYADALAHVQCMRRDEQSFGLTLHFKLQKLKLFWDIPTSEFSVADDWAIPMKKRNKEEHSKTGNIFFSLMTIPYCFSFYFIGLFSFNKVQLPALAFATLTSLVSSVYVGYINNSSSLQEVTIVLHYMLTLRPLFNIFRSTLFAVTSWLDRPFIYSFGSWLLDIGHITLFSYVAVGVITVNMSYIILCINLTIGWMIVVVFVFLPFVVLMNVAFIVSCCTMILKFLFGYPFNLEYGRIRTFNLMYKIGLAFPKLIGSLVISLLSNTGFFKGVWRLSLATVRLPFEVITIVLGDGQLVGSAWTMRYFWTRFFLGLDLAVAYLLGLKLLVFMTLGFIAAFISFSTYIMTFFYGGDAFSPFAITIFQFLKGLFGPSLDFLPNLAHVNLKKSVVMTVIWTRSFRSNDYVFYTGSDGKVRRFHYRSDPNILDDPVALNVIYRKLFYVGPGLQPLLTLVIVMALTGKFVGNIARVSARVFWAPVVLLNAITYFLLPFLVPDFIFDYCYFGLYHFVGFLQDPDFEVWLYIRRWARMLGLGAFVGYNYLAGPISSKISGGGDDMKSKINQLFVLSWVSLTRRSVLKFVETMDKIRLPEMIQAAYNPPSLDSIRSTYVTMQGMGFPVDQSFLDSLTRPESSSYLAEWGSFRNYLIGTSNYALGFKPMRVLRHMWLPKDFFPEIPGYIHTTQFTGVAEVITSTARYWTGNELDDLPEGMTIDELVDDTYHLVKAQYDNSKLITLKKSLDVWLEGKKKKFNVGPGFTYTDPKTNKLKQMTRKAIIASVGGERKMLSMWQKVFYNAQKMVLPSPVFTKWETLKLEKAINRKVRTVLGSALIEKIMSHVYSYDPSHNYHPFEVPAKVGMPINGQNFNRMWESHMGHERVWAGDMKAFDSSIPPVLIKCIAEVRKKGYTYHRDYEKICQLIDITYQMLRDQPLAFKEFGDIAVKKQGFTTGHGATTPDNSLGLPMIYLWLWKEVTGLRAREFENFNRLSNFGDDHVLSYDPVFGWSPQEGIRRLEQKLGIVMKDEAPGEYTLPRVGATPPHKNDWRCSKFSFLSKIPLPIDATIASELAAAGVTVPLSFATCHDRERLIGKIKGQVLAQRARQPFAAYDACVSYMYLCAHHPDIHSKLMSTAEGMYLQLLTTCKRQGKNPNSLPVPPSYNKVISTWYSADPFPYKTVGDDDLVENDEDLDRIYLHSSPDPFGIFIRWISDFPTLLSPRYRNTRWADWIQNKLADRLAWPLVFVAAANGCSNDLMTSKLLLARSPYSFLRSEAIVVNDFGVKAFQRNLARHWIFLLCSRSFTYRKAFSPLDLVRLLDSFWINLVFVLTGRISQVAVELDLHILDTMLILLISYVHIELPLPPILIDLLTPSVLVARFLTYCMSFVSPAGSIDFQPFDEQIRHLMHDNNASFILQAPTGVGKSTRMINRVQNLIGGKVVVIVPRRAVVLNVGKYMQQMYPSSGIGMATEGFSPSPNDRIVYTTVQSFFANPDLRAPNNLFVLDEAHIDEPHYHVMRNFLANGALKKIFVTATPPSDLNYPRLILPATNSFQIVRRVVENSTIDDYLKAAAMFANDRLSNEKTLIFVPTIAHMDRVAVLIKHKICRLSSRHKHIDESASVFISTSVTDAGVTIPDVAFVLSPDLDIKVTTVRNSKREIVSNPFFFKISEQTISQRAGRTGRTSDGVFLLFKIIELPVQDIDYSLLDYMEGLAPSTAHSFQYFPPHFFKDVPEDFELFLQAYDLAPNTVSEHLHKVLDAKEEGFDVYNAYQQTKAQAFGSIKNYWDNYKRSVKVRGPERIPFSKDPDALGMQNPIFFNKELIPKDENPPKPKTLATGKIDKFERQNVSGSGLLCAVRCAIGLVYTHRGYRLSEQFMHELMVSIIDGQRIDMFEVADLETLLIDVFRLLPTFDIIRYNATGRQISTYGPRNDRDYARAGHIPVVVYWEGAHFNYLGMPLTGVPENDAAFTMFEPLDESYTIKTFRSSDHED